MTSHRPSNKSSEQNSGSIVGLNPGQRAAVEHGDGPLLVVAGAGTGKTRVIVERIRNLLETNPKLEGESILGLTFTDKAAGGMKYRVVQAIGERAEHVSQILPGKDSTGYQSGFGAAG
jgi:superfamily I DNA/RNA helicase